MNVSQPPALHPIRRTLRTAAFSSLALFGSIAGASAQSITVDINVPTMDKNGYAHSSSGGGPRIGAFIFGAVGEPDTDDRASQFFNRFGTSLSVPAGLGADNYQIQSATFTLTLMTGDAVVFDGTYDSFTTYDPVTGAPVNDLDAGRPIELYGAAFRNGTTKAFTDENLPFGNANIEGGRNIYATDFNLGASLNGANRDVSNNIAELFDALPFAIGQVLAADLNPDGTIKEDANIVFTLNLNNPNVVKYLQLSLDAGSVDFMVTSLHGGEQGGAVTYPDFYTKESFGAGALPGRLDMQVVIPEPSAITFLLCSFGLFVGCWRGRQALQSGVSNL